MGIQQSKEARKRKDENEKPGQNQFVSPVQEKYFNKCIPLHKAALKGNWEAAERLLNKEPSLVRAPITQGGETALHISAIEGHISFVDNLLRKMNNSDMEIPNKNGATALCFAAATGNVEIAKLMVQKHPELLRIKKDDWIAPLYVAASHGHKDMAKYLFKSDDFKDWDTNDQISLLTKSIDLGLYDLAITIVKENEKLVITEDDNGETPLEVLARKPSAFHGTSENKWSATIANYTIRRFLKINIQETEESCDAYGLFDFLWNKMIRQQDVETGESVNGRTPKLLFIAAKFGNDNFVVELIRQYPDFLYQMNDLNHSIFHIAILHRNVQVFNLIYELNGVKDVIATYVDKDGNNILHLAAKLAPQEQLNCIPGQALQMQREVLWYKEVEKIVQPTCKQMKNSNKQTPYDLFLVEHGNLMKEGEKMLKQIAKSCMLVTMLISTVVFTTTFTVPGGYNNNTGVPILQNEKLFMVFPISEAVATLCSLISMLMFLSILTSRYTETEFLNSLPFWLVIGVVALFISIAAMMVSFCTCLLFYQHGLAAITALLIFFATVPIMFMILKYPLLVTILDCSFRGRWLFRSNNRLFT